MNDKKPKLKCTGPAAGIVSVLSGGREFALDLPPENSGQNLLQIIYLSGLFEPPPLCAGISLCGRCRVRFIKGAPAPLTEDIKALGQECVNDGWRLCCRHKAAAGMRLELPDEVRLLDAAAGCEAAVDIKMHAGDMPVAQSAVAAARTNERTGSDMPVKAEAKKTEFSGGARGCSGLENAARNLSPGIENFNNEGGGVCLAVDFGSTSLHYAAVTGDAPLDAAIAVNPQIGAGSDIISRLAFARRSGGITRLAGVSRAAIARMVREAGMNSGAGTVGEICLAANPAMTMLVLEKDISGLAAAPYRLDYRAGSCENIPGLPPMWVAPLIGPFVGGDISAGYAFLACEQGAQYPFVLADMGTNGEFILALSPTEALAASLPLGPALEGIGMRCGSEARPGVVTGFALSPSGLAPQIFSGGASGQPSGQLSERLLGMSGTAYISLAAQLLRQGIIEPSGLFARSRPAMPLAARLWGQLRDTEAGRAFYVSDSLYLAAADVEELVKIKGAFSLALKLLLAEAGLGFADLSRLYLAGSLGAHVDVAALEKLGFIPPGGGAKVEAVGNTSLAGAALLCKKPELRQNLADWAARVRVLDLVEAGDFQAGYAAEMRFVW